jgi:ubiquitin C-terminal hydrolase
MCGAETIWKKNCQRIAFPIVLDMIPYAVERHVSHRYQLVGIISHIGSPQEHLGHYIAFLRFLGPWVRFNDVEVDPVEESAALQDNFPDKDGSTQTASILLDLAEN